MRIKEYSAEKFRYVCHIAKDLLPLLPAKVKVGGTDYILMIDSHSVCYEKNKTQIFRTHGKPLTVMLEEAIDWVDKTLDRKQLYMSK